jgi:hypothetical protein
LITCIAPAFVAPLAQAEVPRWSRIVEDSGAKLD